MLDLGRNLGARAQAAGAACTSFEGLRSDLPRVRLSCPASPWPEPPLHTPIAELPPMLLGTGRGAVTSRLATPRASARLAS